MNLHIRLTFILFILSFLSCEKLEVTPEELILEDFIADCTDDYSEVAINIDEEFYPFACVQLVIEVTYPDLSSYQYPVFNPNNLNQVAFLGWDGINWSDKNNLFTFDFCTGDKKILLDSVFPRTIDWSNKDWILFKNYEDSKIWKVKSNGDSLTQVSTQGICSYPNWNDEGNQFAYGKYDSNDYRIIIANESGEVLDSINEYYGNPIRWQGKYITFETGVPEFLSFYNTETQEIEFTFDNLDSLDLGNPIYFEQSNQLLLNGRHLVLLNMTTGFKDTIYSGADNRKVTNYDIIDYEDNIYLLNTRANIVQISTCEMEKDLELSMINLTTGVERIIQLPE